MIKLSLFLTCIIPVCLMAQPFGFTHDLPPLDSIKHFKKIPIPKFDTNKIGGMAFGRAIDTTIKFIETAQKDTINDTIVYRCALTLEKATSININYRLFRIGHNAVMTIYEPSQTHFLGPFTSESNPSKASYATSLLFSSTVILELVTPLYSNKSSEIEMSSIIYGYKPFIDFKEAFGSSQSCQINAICDIDSLAQSIKSSIMILAGNNNRVCSGTLINTMNSDTSPLVLTAEHCPYNPANSIVLFDYMSSLCENNLDGNTNKTIVGGSVIASSKKTDFKLIKLSRTPPISYNTYYSGWSTESFIYNTPIYSVHHPSGDIKKISKGIINHSIGSKSISIDSYIDIQWQNGVTEPGSSGSGLFVKRGSNAFLIGQLYGGFSTCNNLNLKDIYGSLRESFSIETGSQNQLKSWLAPNALSTEIRFPGMSPTAPIPTHDIAIIGINNKPRLNSAFLCGSKVAPRIEVFNLGTDSIFGFDIIYTLDSNISTTKSWIGNLPPKTSTIITLDSLSLNTQKPYTFTATTSNLQPMPDLNTKNDTFVKTIFGVQDAKEINIVINYDEYPEEIQFHIFPKYPQNQTQSLYSMTNNLGKYSAGTSYQKDSFSVCLSSNCYTLRLDDSEGDGFCCNFGVGSIEILDEQNQRLLFNNNFNGSSTQFDFCLGDSCTITIDPIIYSTSDNTQGSITLNTKGGSGRYNYMWSNGMTTDSIGNLSQGVYSVTISDSNYTNCSYSQRFKINNKSLFDLTSYTQQDFVNVFPNPSSKSSDVIISINQKTLSISNIKLFNYLGQTIPIQLKQTSQEGQYTFNKNLTSGLYIIKAELSNGIIETKKLVIKY